MKVMKYFGSLLSISGQQMFVCMISNKCLFLVEPFFDLLVCFTLMQTKHVPKSVKFTALNTPSFTNLLIL